MRHQGIKKILMISFITALLLFSTAIAVFTASADSSSEFSQAQDKPDAPPDDVGPVKLDPGNMPRKIGNFEGKAGAFVSFDTVENGISNHYLNGENQQIKIFEKISVEEFGKLDEESMGHTYFLKGDGAEFQLYDNPSTMLKLDVYPTEESGRNVSFELGDMEVGETEKGRVSIIKDDYSGSLLSIDIFGPGRQDPRERDDFRNENNGSINFTVRERATFIFRMEMDGFQERVRDFVRGKMRTGRIGAEFRIESSSEGYNQISFSYREVNLKAKMREESTLEMLVSSKTLGEEGTLLILDISSTVMNISSREDIDLRFDGETADFTDEISELDKSDDPIYTLIDGKEGTHLLVKVPNFSTHSITVEHITDSMDQYLGSFNYYIPAAMASVGLVTIGLLYRKNEKKDKKKKDSDQKNKRVSINGDPKSYEKGKGSEKRIKSSKNDKDGETRVRKD